MRRDVVVVGGGIVGSATARALARQGRSVLLLERFPFGHERGSSHGSVRAFAFAHPDAALVDDAVEAMALWRELEAEQDVELVTTTASGLRVAERDAILARLEAHGLAHEVLEADELARRFDIVLAPGEPVILTEQGGTIHAARALEAMRAAARAAGAELRDRTVVSALEPAGDGVVITLEDGGKVTAGAAVVTAGGWTTRLLATAGIEVATKVTRQVIAYYPYEHPGLYPCVFEDGAPPVYWVSAPGEGLKIGEARQGPDEPAVDPERPADAVDARVERLTAYVAQHFPRVTPRPTIVETCLMTDTRDGDFRYDRVGPIAYAVACGGRGFKMSPRSGALLAELAGAALAEEAAR
jgi:sarcosine oxidase